MSRERDIIETVYHFLYDRKHLHDIAEVINYSCDWDNGGALCKVKYWLKYGLKHNGDYTGIPNINYALIHPNCPVPVEDIELAFNLLEKTKKEYDSRISKHFA